MDALQQLVETWHERVKELRQASAEAPTGFRQIAEAITPHRVDEINRCILELLALLGEPPQHLERANALRGEMCRLASWSQTPDAVAEALMAAVKADNDRLAALSVPTQTKEPI